MADSKRAYDIGIDFSQGVAMISYWREGEEEPVTMSTVAGSEAYQIPILLAKKRGMGQWFFGDEAQKVVELDTSLCVDNLLIRAKRRERVLIEDMEYEALDLFALFVQKVMQLPGKLGNPMIPDRLVIVLKEVEKETVSLFSSILPQLGMKQSQLLVIDKKESFYYFAFHQRKELWFHDVCLFDCEQGKIKTYYATRNQKTIPQMIEITEDEMLFSDSDKDGQFYHYALGLFQKKIVSSVYLIGDGFDGNWMKQSLAFLCKGRRVFLGKNLYSKGACYAAICKQQETDWPFVYMGDNEMKVNVSLKVRDSGETRFFTLITAGENWYETNGSCEVILDGTKEIQFWLQLPNSREAKIETLELSDLPKRPNKTTRLRIFAKPLSDEAVSVRITDLGFGDWFESSQKTWEYTMTL